MRLRKKRHTRSVYTRRRCNAWPLKRGKKEKEGERAVDKSADNTIRPIINLIVISIGIENRPRSASG